MSHFQFAHPWALWLLLLIPALAILRGRFGREAAVQYSGLSLLGPLIRQRKSRAGGWLTALMYATLACLLVALARPQKRHRYHAGDRSFALDGGARLSQERPGAQPRRCGA